MSFESVKAIIDGQAYDSLIGLPEDGWLEAKSSTPYNLGNPEGRYELAKDVAAFANGTGGVIITGLRTTRHANTQTDEITAYDLCAQATFNPNQYTSLINEYVHPAIEGLAIYWVPVNPEGTDGLGVIEVPPQNPDRQYFLIANAVDDGSRIRQFVFGIVRRNESSNDPFTIAELYRHIQKGKGSLAQTLTRIEDKLDAVLIQGRPADTSDPEEIYAERAARILDEEEGLMSKGRPIFIYSMTPRGKTAYKQFFEPDDLKKIIEEPGRIRHAGWDLTTRDRARIVNGEYLEVASAERKRIRVYEDGSVLVRVSGDEDFLSWGQSTDNFDKAPRLNTLSLIEFTLNFCRLCSRLAELMEPRPGEVILRVEIKNAFLATPSSS